jgi:hypothetical protein
VAGVSASVLVMSLSQLEQCVCLICRSILVEVVGDEDGAPERILRSFVGVGYLPSVDDSLEEAPLPSMSCSTRRSRKPLTFDALEALLGGMAATRRSVFSRL